MPGRRDPFNNDTTVFILTARPGTTRFVRWGLLLVYNWSQYYWSWSHSQFPVLGPIVLDLVIASVNVVVNRLDARYVGVYSHSKILEGWLDWRQVSKATWGYFVVVLVCV